MLLRFAGPHLAEQSDQLLPVRLRRGGRTIGGALSWEQPAQLAPFAPESPFAGLAIPADVTVTRQVLAEPDLDLANKTWARLADGTPLVTAEKLGKGWTVLVHTTANTEWSNLALSGLFVEMLRRVVGDEPGRRGGERATRCRRSRRSTGSAGCSAPPPTGAADFRHGDRDRDAVAAPSARLLRRRRLAARAEPVGRDRRAEADRRRCPAGSRASRFDQKSAEVDLRPPLLTAAFLLVLIDLLIAYALRGLLRPPRRAGRDGRRPAGRDAAGRGAAAQADDAFVVRATSELRLAYVRTGDREVDAVSRAGLVGLTATLNRRTAVETAEPLAVDIESDELIFFPLLYWPVTAGAGAALAARRRAHQPLSRNRRHDPVRHPRRRRRDAGTVRQRRVVAGAAAPAGRRDQDPAAGAGAARPRADQVVLPAARVSRPLEQRPGVGRAGRGPGQ